MSNNRIRRVVLLCASFSRNLAFYRALHERRALFDTNHPHASFWRQAYANFIYTAVLDWCKLFGENKSKYHWRKFVSKPDEFEQSLLHAIQVDANGFAECITSMRRYRD